MGEVKTRGIVRYIAAADQTKKVGYAVTLSGDTLTVATAADANIIGVILDGGEKDDYTDIALLGAYDGTLRLKAGDNITAGKRVMLKADGTWDCAVTGLACGIALESAVTDELFEAAPRTPVTIA